MDEITDNKGEYSSDPVSRAAHGGIVIALAIALGYALAAVPNIELVTISLALGGYILGGGWGAIAGGLGFGLYSILSPYGVAPPPVLLAQIMGGVIIGFGGYLLKAGFQRFEKRRIRIGLSATIGFIITFSYDLLTNIGSFIIVSSESTFIPFIIGGLGFAVIHMLSNCLIFGILFVPLTSVIEKVTSHRF